MKRSPPASQFRNFVMAGILMIAGALTGCAGGQAVTPEALEQAKQLWTEGRHPRL